MRNLKNIFWLGTKEFRSVFSDPIMLFLIIWAFSFSIYARATSKGETVNNASIAIVDEDHSELSRRIATALYPPFFKRPELIDITQVDRAMDHGRYMFVLIVPPRFEADVRKRRKPGVQLNIDATAVLQANLGALYIQNIVLNEVTQFAQRSSVESAPPVTLITRRAFNPNGTQSWFDAIVSLLDQLSLITIVLTGAALLREREHGTIEHLLVMPITSFEIVLAKVWANGLVILAAFTFSMLFVVEGALNIPISGSKWLLIAGTVIYLFAAAAIGIFLGTIARSMAQFSLLMTMTIVPIMMLSGGMSPIESQPDIIQPLTWLLPSRHYMAFAQAIVFRGAGLEIVWVDFLTVALLGGAFFVASLLMFRNSIAVTK